MIFGGTAAVLIGFAVACLWHLRWVRRLPALDSLVGREGVDVSWGGQSIRCSVVVAARDEEARIEQTVRHLFALQGVEVEFIVVDDRSRDRTLEILHRLANEDPRLRVKQVDQLPEGWLGKCHACHIGANMATGEWLLFTDADCWLAPDVIQRAVIVAKQTGADHVTMSAGTVLEGVGAKAWYLLFVTSLLGWFSGVNRDRRNAYVGIGAFNLVRASAYRECGGYEALRLTVLDDVKLGRLLQRAGKRTRAFLGGHDVECHWGTTVAAMVKIMEKNYFAAADFRLWVVVGGSLVSLLMVAILVAGALSGTMSGIAAALSPLAGIAPAGVLAQRHGWSWRCAVAVPFMFPVFLYALLRSTWVTLRQGGVRWRETFYPLSVLRAGTVR